MGDSIFLDIDGFRAAEDIDHWNHVGAIIGITRTGNVFDLQTGTGPAPQITILSPTLFRLRFNAAGDYRQDFSYALPQPAVAFAGAVTLADNGTSFEIDTGVLRLVIQKAEYALSVFRGAQLIHQDAERNLVYILQSVANFKILQKGALFYGFGEKAGMSLNKAGRTMTFFNFDNFSYATGDDQAMYASIPFLIETNPTAAAPYSYGMFLDNPSQTYIDLGHRVEGQYYLGAVYGEMNTYFIYGDRIGEIVRQYVALTGPPPLPPKYVFGFHQGAYGYNVGVGQNGLGQFRQSVKDVASSYRNNNIPCDGLHLDVDFQHEYRMFTAGSSNSRRDPVTFGDPVKLLHDLHSLGFKCSTNITPMIKDDRGTVLNAPGGPPDPYSSRDDGFQQNVFLRNPGNQPSEFFTGTVDYGSDPIPINGEKLGATGFYADLTDPKARAWYGAQYDFLINTVKMDMIWQDMTDPAIGNGVSKTMRADLIQHDFGRNTPHVQIHNAYANTLLQATTEGLSKLRPTERNFIISRGGYAGMQRYAGLWTGDSSSDWDHYLVMLPMILNLGLSGVPISGCDIGGFARGAGVGSDDVVSQELLIRWMTLGAFLPWYRNHYNSYDKRHQEPFNYADPVVATACRKYIEIRYRLLQLFYDLMWTAHLSGMPIARALFLNDPDDLRVYEDAWARTEFFLGHDLLVAPIMTQGSLGRTIYLPTGSDWYAFEPLGKLGQKFGGGSNWLQPATISDVPAYVREGAIIPFRPLEQFVGEKPTAPLTITIWPGRDQVYTLHQDDGHSTAYEVSAAYRSTEISTLTGAAGARSIRLRRRQDAFTPAEDHYFIKLLGVTAAPNGVAAGGAALPLAASATALESAALNGFFYDPPSESVLVKIFDTAADLTVTVQP